MEVMVALFVPFFVFWLFEVVMVLLVDFIEAFGNIFK